MNQMISGSQAQAMAQATDDAELLDLWRQFIDQYQKTEIIRLEANKLYKSAYANIPGMKAWHERGFSDDVPYPSEDDWLAWETNYKANGYCSSVRRWDEGFKRMRQIRKAMFRKTPAGPLGIGLQLATMFLPPYSTDGDCIDRIEGDQAQSVFAALRSISNLSGVDLIAELPKPMTAA